MPFRAALTSRSRASGPDKIVGITVIGGNEDCGGGAGIADCTGNESFTRCIASDGDLAGVVGVTERP